MESAFIKMLATAGVISIAAVCAPIMNRFRNAPAASCALAGGVLPWLTFAILYRWPTLSWLALLSLAFMASFLFALFFYAVEEPTKSRTTVLASIAVASCAAIYFGVLIGYPLLLAGI